MNEVGAFLLQQAVDFILGHGVLNHASGAVQRWAEKELAGHEKMTGVINELEVIGLHLAEASARFAVEAAIQYNRAKGLPT